MQQPFSQMDNWHDGYSSNTLSPVQVSHNRGKF